MIKRIIIAAVIILVITGIITAAAVYMKKHKNDYILDGPGMVRQPHDYINYCSYSYGGGMEGKSEHIELTRRSDGSYTYSYSYCPYNGGEETVIEKTFSDYEPVMDEIREICKRTGVLTWGELPKSELLLLDAPTATVSFRYFDNCFYSVNSDDILPEEGNGIFSDIYDYLKSLK